MRLGLLIAATLGAVSFRPEIIERPAPKWEAGRRPWTPPSICPEQRRQQEAMNRKRFGKRRAA